MKSLTHILSHSTTRFVIWVLIFLFPLLFIWQGGDLTDTGYNVTVYHFFFDRLNQGITDSLIFFTEMIGGTWMYLFPFLGILGVKLLAVIFFYINIILSWRVLSDLFPKSRLIPFFLLAAVAFSIRAFPIVFNYDLLTSFFLLLFIFLFRKKENCFTYQNFILLGILSAFMTFARFPNVFVLILFPSAIILARMLGFISLKFKFYIQLFTLYFLGFIIGVMSFMTFLASFGWYDAFANNFLNLSNMFADNNESYNLSYVLQKYYLDSLYFSIYLVATALLFFGCKYALQKWNQVIVISLIFLLGLCVFSLYPFVFNYNNSIKYIVPSLILISFIAYKPNKKIAFISILLFFFMLIQIAGSNTGIFLKISLLFILAFPLAMLHLSHKLPQKLSLFGIIPGIYTLIISSFIYVVFIYNFGYSPTMRLQAIYPIEIPQYVGIRTTQIQAQKIENIVDAVVSVKNEGQKMFVYGHQPMLYYLTDCEPVLKEFWLVGNNLTSFPELFSQMSRLESKPLFIDTKERIFSKEDEQSKQLFLSNNKYQLVKSTESYDIWKVKN